MLLQPFPFQIRALSSDLLRRDVTKKCCCCCCCCRCVVVVVVHWRRAGNGPNDGGATVVEIVDGGNSRGKLEQFIDVLSIYVYELMVYVLCTRIECTKSMEGVWLKCLALLSIYLENRIGAAVIPFSACILKSYSRSSHALHFLHYVHRELTLYFTSNSSQSVIGLCVSVGSLNVMSMGGYRRTVKWGVSFEDAV